MTSRYLGNPAVRMIKIKKVIRIILADKGRKFNKLTFFFRKHIRTVVIEITKIIKKIIFPGKNSNEARRQVFKKIKPIVFINFFLKNSDFTILMNPFNIILIIKIRKNLLVPNVL